jgi:hypothetical protein
VGATYSIALNQAVVLRVLCLLCRGLIFARVSASEQSKTLVTVVCATALAICYTS